MTGTADSTLWTADTHCVTADGRIICIDAAVVEAAAAAEIVDSVVQWAGVAVVSEAAYAVETLDAVVQPAIVVVIGGGTYRPELPLPVEGIGDGILPRLIGEAHGVVIAASAGAGTLRGFVAVADGSAGAVGHSAAQFVIRAAAVGARGQAGIAAAVLDGLGAAGSGAVITRGQGSGVIANLEAAAIGRCDDDEAVVAWLLAA